MIRLSKICSFQGWWDLLPYYKSVFQQASMIETAARGKLASMLSYNLRVECVTAFVTEAYMETQVYNPLNLLIKRTCRLHSQCVVNLDCFFLKIKIKY